jgi:lysophospholipase L1-like esterase
MKTIVCFGDSNTWGADPLQGPRFNMEQRWPGVLRTELGAGYWVIEEGMCGRSVVYDDPVEDYQCGRNYLISCIQSHTPVDLLIMMLGTNDLKKRFFLPACDIAKGVGGLADLVRKASYPCGYHAPQILLIAASYPGGGPIPGNVCGRRWKIVKIRDILCRDCSYVRVSFYRCR